MPGKLVAEAASVNVGRSGDANAQAWFRGGIDDLRYWSVARTAAQISDDMNLFLTGKEAGLVALEGNARAYTYVPRRESADEAASLVADITGTEET